MSSRGIVRIVLFSAGALLVGCSTAASTGPSPSGTGGDRRGSATVSRVIDGDTIVVDLSGHDERVRLIGIDTPETVSPTKPVQCYGPQASHHTKALLPPGTRVRLERDVDERDAYGRLLAYVYRSADGLFVNLDLAVQGYASLLTYPPNVAHRGQFTGAVDAAQRERRGLWGSCGRGTPPAAATSGEGSVPEPEKEPLASHQ